ncbi:TPA: excinuclease ABC subunit C [Candidatus Latescibacteria bacterium]|nr:excinuclease ABC subunit C [Candidatus Latescibacterota bacterium]
MYSTYILESLDSRKRRYIGWTANLRSRLRSHNEGNSAATGKYRPWKVKLCVAFESVQLA